MFLSPNNTEKFNSHVYSYKMLTFSLFCTFSFFSFITFSSLYTNFTRKISLITIAFLFFVKLTRKKYKSCKNLNWKISNYYISIPFIFKIEIKYFHRRFFTNDIVGKWNNFHHCFSTKQSFIRYSKYISIVSIENTCLPWSLFILVSPLRTDFFFFFFTIFEPSLIQHCWLIEPCLGTYYDL